MTLKIKRFLQTTLVLLFCISILLSLGMRVLSVRDNKDYDVLQPELRFPDLISYFLYEESLAQIYVCYNDASYVNVYSEDGTFLWAVSAPYMRNISFSIQDGCLVLDGRDEAYIYDADEGKFLRRTEEHMEHTVIEHMNTGFFSYDSFQVYRHLPDGNAITVVSRPLWYHIGNFGITWLTGFSCGLGYFALEYFEKIRNWYHARKSVPIQSTKARICILYLQLKCIIQLLFAIVDIVLGYIGTDISFYLMFVGIHFIISGIVIVNVLACDNADADQTKIYSFWKATDFVTFFAAFLSVIIANAFLGNL